MYYVVMTFKKVKSFLVWAIDCFINMRSSKFLLEWVQRNYNILGHFLLANTVLWCHCFNWMNQWSHLFISNSKFYFIQNFTSYFNPPVFSVWQGAVGSDDWHGDGEQQPKSGPLLPHHDRPHLSRPTPNHHQHDHHSSTQESAVQVGSSLFRVK